MADEWLILTFSLVPSYFKVVHLHTVLSALCQVLIIESDFQLKFPKTKVLGRSKQIPNIIRVFGAQTLNDKSKLRGLEFLHPLTAKKFQSPDCNSVSPAELELRGPL